jgi:zinc protease
VEELLFPHHPYGRPIIGYPETLQALRPTDMRAYYQRFYHPGNATLVVAGDIDARRALAAVKARFQRIPPGPAFASVDCFRRKLEEPSGEKRVDMTWDDPGRRLLVVWPTARVGSGDDDALDVLTMVLAGGRMSRLWRRLVLEEGLATSVSANNDTRVEAGAFWLYAECAQGVEPARLERALHAEFARLSSEKIERGELERAHALLLAGEAFEGETMTDVAEALAEWAVDDDWRRAFDGCRRHLALTTADLRAAAQRYLQPERRVVGWCVPEPERGAKRRKRAQ